jgi:Tol biopolymer transport system component
MRIAVWGILILIVFVGCRKNRDEKNNIEKAIAFVVQKDATTANLWYIAADGTSFAEVLSDNLGSAINNPTWSADGRRIFFIKSSPNKGENGIFSVRPNGSELNTVYKDNDEQLRKYYQLCADNKDENIIFSLDIPRTGRKVIELYTMCPCGDRVVRLTQFETSSDVPGSTESYAGSFSKGDSILIFTQSNPEITTLKEVQIYTMNIVSKEITLLRKIKAKSAVTCTPSFSPTGGRILLSIDGVINSMNPDGTDLKPLGSLKGYRPTWDKDGTHFYFSSYGIEGMEQGIFETDVHLNNIKRITRSSAIGIHGGFSINQ